jgi:hypothetical protein
MERELTKFQTYCEQRLVSRLAKAGKRIANRRLDGVSETYITRNIEGSDITFWIYREMADFATRNGGRVFEKPDYDSSDELAEEFIERLVEATR